MKSPLKYPGPDLLGGKSHYNSV